MSGTSLVPKTGPARERQYARARHVAVDVGSGRLLSLDAFRGMTIAAMLLVNNPGSWTHIYPPLRHAEWHGWTPTDLIFPFFLFIAGVSMTFSFARMRERGVTEGAIVNRALRRAVILFGLGLLLHGFPSYDLSTIRIPGVLQRIALAVALATPIVLLLDRRRRALLATSLLLGYWALLTLVPIPGGSAPSLEPGRDLGAWLDRLVFGEAHLWAQSRTWDPEGLLSTLPALATLLAGTIAGSRLRASPGPRVVRDLVIAGTVGLILGSVWDLAFPINKNLWTSSYVVFTAGFACILFAICYWLIDVRGRRRWSAPLVVFGTNAIAAFFLSSLFARVLGLMQVGGGSGESMSVKAWLWTNAFAPLAPPRLASLLFAVVYTLLWMAVMAVLHRRRILIRV